MQLNRTYSADEIATDGDGDFSPVPEGWYRVDIVGCEVKETRAGNGSYLSFRFDITDGKYSKRVIWHNCNIENPNPKAEQIGQDQMGQIMRAIGLKNVNDTDQFIGGTLEIYTKIEKSEKYGDKNIAKKFRSVSGSAAPMPASKSASSSKAPW